MSDVDAQLRRLARRPLNQVPVGGMILLAGAAAPPPGWLIANGATFSATADTGYPRLSARLGGTTLPNPTAVTGGTWIIRAR